MNLNRALEPKPLLVAAAIGAVGFLILRRQGFSDVLLGALLGGVVQAGVRVSGVS